MCWAVCMCVHVSGTRASAGCVLGMHGHGCVCWGRTGALDWVVVKRASERVSRHVAACVGDE